MEAIGAAAGRLQGLHLTPHWELEDAVILLEVLSFATPPLHSSTLLSCVWRKDAAVESLDFDFEATVLFWQKVRSGNCRHLTSFPAACTRGPEMPFANLEIFFPTLPNGESQNTAKVNNLPIHVRTVS
jgi:hypothetical protein